MKRSVFLRSLKHACSLNLNNQECRSEAEIDGAGENKKGDL